MKVILLSVFLLLNLYCFTKINPVTLQTRSTPPITGHVRVLYWIHLWYEYESHIWDGRTDGWMVRWMEILVLQRDLLCNIVVLWVQCRQYNFNIFNLNDILCKINLNGSWMDSSATTFRNAVIICHLTIQLSLSHFMAITQCLVQVY